MFLQLFKYAGLETEKDARKRRKNIEGFAGRNGRGGNRVVSGSECPRSVRVQSDSPRVTVKLGERCRISRLLICQAVPSTSQ